MRLPLVAFDIDGTLLRTRGAGRQALDEAFQVHFGWRDATEGVNVAGATDEVICRDVAARFGAPWTAEDTAAVRATYLEALDRRLGEPDRTDVLPGVTTLLDALAGRAHVALLTGNWFAGAERKLRAAGLVDRFAFGAFAEDAVDRNGLVPVVRARAEDRGLDVAGVIVIGDTVNDVACARAGGAAVVVVETGFCTPDALAEAAPDLQVHDLERGAAWVLALVRATAERAGPPPGTPQSLRGRA
jgi:phosphoglycolate phosphatase-like HAD superfamily hydrolase